MRDVFEERQTTQKVDSDNRNRQNAPPPHKPTLLADMMPVYWDADNMPMSCCEEDDIRSSPLVGLRRRASDEPETYRGPVQDQFDTVEMLLTGTRYQRSARRSKWSSEAAPQSGHGGVCFADQADLEIRSAFPHAHSFTHTTAHDERLHMLQPVRVPTRWGAEKGRLWYLRGEGVAQDANCLVCHCTLLVLCCSAEDEQAFF